MTVIFAGVGDGVVEAVASGLASCAKEIGEKNPATRRSARSRNAPLPGVRGVFMA
jgi:hypothetical protein